MNDRTTIQFDAAKVERLRAAYADARQRGATEFVFDGHALVTDYAMYLLEYLDGRLCQDCG